MNLWMRFLKVLLFSRFRSELDTLDEGSIDFRVWLPDLDVLRHMNNGRYLTLMDLGRIDLMIRSGLAQKLSEQGFYPVVAEEMIRFRRSLSPFQKFRLKTRVEAWDGKFFFVRQEFVARGESVAVGYVKARFLKKSGGGVTPDEVLALAGRKDLQMRNPKLKEDWDRLGPYFDTKNPQ